MDQDVSTQVAALFAERERRRRLRARAVESGDITHSVWTPDGGIYINRETGVRYQPHHDEEASFVYSDTPRYFLCKGGEGSGKSVAGVVKALERLRRGCNGIMGSPDFEHFKRSLWPEFQRWCPYDSLIPQQRYRLRNSWVPNAPFSMAFRIPGADRNSTLLCGGFDDPGGWEGPNVNFALFDEARRHRTPDMLKVLDGRCRIMGGQDKSIPPQMFFPTTPRKHWLYQYFGPWEGEGADPLAAFKARARVITLRLVDNESNLSTDYIENRHSSLTSAEQRVLLDAEWEDIDDVSPFLSSMIWWDRCKEVLPAPTIEESMILIIDAATGRKTASSDCFALVMMSRHPDPERAERHVAIRYSNYWRARAGEKISFEGTDEAPGPLKEVKRLCEEFNVVALVYDPSQMVFAAQELEEDNIVWCWEFTQQTERLKSDRLLLDIIVAQRIAHDGNSDLRAHVANADRKVTGDSEDDSDKKRTFRIVKGRGPIDLLVAVSMGAKRCLELNI